MEQRVRGNVRSLATDPDLSLRSASVGQGGFGFGETENDLRVSAADADVVS